jgi:hypothetical protein
MSNVDTTSLRKLLKKWQAIEDLAPSSSTIFVHERVVQGILDCAMQLEKVIEEIENTPAMEPFDSRKVPTAEEPFTTRLVDEGYLERIDPNTTVMDPFNTSGDRPTNLALGDTGFQIVEQLRNKFERDTENVGDEKIGNNSPLHFDVWRARSISHLVSEENLILRGLEELYPENRFIKGLYRCVEKYPDANWGAAMSRGQIRSKLWIIHELLRHNFTRLGSVCICGGWYGILSRLLLDNEKIHIHHVTTLDLEMECSDIAAELNAEYKSNDRFSDLTTDMCSVSDYMRHDTIINTSCEHLTHEDFQRWWALIPKGKLVLLQNNNFFNIQEHKSCVSDENELRDSAPMTTVHFCGVMDTHKNKRFMVIGTK